MSCRKIKFEVLELLGQRNLESISARLRQLPPKDVINALFSAICREDQRVKWHAVSCMGEAVASLASQDLEAARIVMRRFLWSLNDESGGIGWGAPECMAEAMSCYSVLAAEYAHMLISYMREDGEEHCQDGNFLEHQLLQRGLLWGVARLSRCEPALMKSKGAGDEIGKYLHSSDPETRGLAALAVSSLGMTDTFSFLHEMTADTSEFSLYDRGRFEAVTVGQLARRVLEKGAN